MDGPEVAVAVHGLAVASPLVEAEAPLVEGSGAGVGVGGWARASSWSTVRGVMLLALLGQVQQAGHAVGPRRACLDVVGAFPGPGARNAADAAGVEAGGVDGAALRIVEHG